MRNTLTDIVLRFSSRLNGDENGTIADQTILRLLRSTYTLDKIRAVSLKKRCERYWSYGCSMPKGLRDHRTICICPRKTHGFPCSPGETRAAAAGAIHAIRCRKVFSLMGHKGKSILHRSSWRIGAGEASSNGNEDESTFCCASASPRGQARKPHQCLPSDGC